MQNFIFSLTLLILTSTGLAGRVFLDGFSGYVTDSSVGGYNWDPTYHGSDTSQRDLITTHSNSYAVLNTAVAKNNYHSPTKTGFVVGTSGAHATVRFDFRYDHASGGDISSNFNKAVFGLLLSTTGNWWDGTNNGLAFCNRGAALGSILPVSPWVEGWVTHSSLGVNTAAGGLSDWLRVEVNVTNVSGSIWIDARVADRDTDTTLYNSTAFDTGIASTNLLYAGVSTHWNNANTNVATVSKFDSIHFDNFLVELCCQPVEVSVDPTVRLAVAGLSELDRSKYISLGMEGFTLEAKITNATQASYYRDTLGMNFGRQLGTVWQSTIYDSAAIQEDPARSGYVDVAHLVANIGSDNVTATQPFIDHYSPNLGIATHERTDAYPSFMTKWYDGSPSNHNYPLNFAAAGELVAKLLRYKHTDFTRPTTYEIVNEPDWRIWSDQRFADLHTAVDDAVDAEGLDVAVGGPCLAVAYFYKNRYQSFNMKDFIANTACDLDFYSFHVYDFMSWNDTDQEFEGRVTTGLPIEGVLDLIQNYTHNEFGRQKPIVLSEHAGYISNDQEGALDTVASNYFPGTGFAFEMKRRSVSEYIAVSSAIANTMAFMNNPHIIQKAVPFILLESAAWDPYYYSTLLVRENFDAGSDVWHESTYINFFKYFQNVSGHKVKMELNDPDIQHHAYVNADKLYILLNNLATKEEELSLDIPTNNVDTITLRRFFRNSDFTPSFTSNTTSSVASITIAPREAIAIEVDYTTSIVELGALNEVPFYADLIQQEFTGKQAFSLQVIDQNAASYAYFRVGVGRDSGSDRDLELSINGVSLPVPMEDSASYLENATEYGSTKVVPVPIALLQASNLVTVAFPNSGTGGVGSVVLRMGVDQSDTDNDGMLDAWEIEHFGSTAVSDGTQNGDGDSINDLQEFLTGNDPQDLSEDFWVNVSQSQSVPSQLNVTWDVAPGRKYCLLYSDDLSPGSFQVMEDNIRYPRNTFEDTLPSGKTSRFYRIQVSDE